MPKLVELEAKSKRDLIDFEIEVRQRHAVTGNIHWALLRSTPRRRPDGSTVWYGVQMDITERKRNEKLLEDANEELHTQLDEIEQLQTELREQALRDPLTGLFNRRYMNEALAREIARAGRENNPLSVIMADIDHFKMINDTYGHPVGDKFVVEIASLMRNHARSSDIVCRYGGEEFLLVLPGTASDFAAQRAEEIRQRCAEIIIQHDEKDLKVTISMGVATYPAHGQKADEIIIKADKALYRAKAQGRNCTVLFE
jgi:diguanylate cyclase (GGDEF)-like protein